MTTYPTQPTGDNIVDLNNIFASNNDSKLLMSTSEILEGYNNKGETETPLTSRPDGNKFNFFWFQVHNTVSWLVSYTLVLFDNKLENSGGTMSGALSMGTNKITNLGTPTSNTDATTKQYVDTAINGSMWLAEVKNLAYPYIPTLPAGMEVVECDGRAISRTTYSQLFSIVGTTWGSGDGSTTFNIPDYRGVTIRGWDNGRGLDVARTFGSYQSSGAPNITGQTGSNDDSAGALSGAFFFKGYPGWTEAGGPGQQPLVGFDASRVSSEYQNNLNEVRMKNTTGYFVIRIK